MFQNCWLEEIPTQPMALSSAEGGRAIVESISHMFFDLSNCFGVY